MTSEGKKALNLLQAGQLDKARQLVTVSEIAEQWLTYHRDDDRHSSKWVEADHPSWWAIEWLYDEPDPAVRRDLIVALVHQAQNEFELGNIGAGPLEVYLDFHLGEATLTWIEAQAARSADFRLALSIIYFDGPDEALERLDQAAGTMLPRPSK